MKLKNLFRYLKDSDYRFAVNVAHGAYRNMPDEEYLKRMFRSKMGYELDLEDPKTFNEKMQWLKLHDRNVEYTTLVDKAAVKDVVAGKIGEQYIIPTIGIFDRVEDIDFDALPDQFVLKCTHDSHGLVICRDKKTLDVEAAKKKLNRCLHTNYYYHFREWPYKNVKPRIIAEQYMEDESDSELKDYKFFCFDGVPKIMFIASDRQTAGVETKFDFFDMDFEHLPFVNGHPNSSKELKKPASFDEMKALASQLSEGMPFVRIDFYDIGGKPYFGEITFYHWSGFQPFDPPQWDETLGSWIHLPKDAQ